MQPTVETLRRELAAAFRLAAKHEFNKGVCNHFSVALPGREERYLIDPYGIHWCEMRPSDLLMIDVAGQVLEGEGEVEATARNIHVAGHRANPRHKAIFHVDMPYATSLTMIEGGRLEMAHQTAARFSAASPTRASAASPSTRPRASASPRPRRTIRTPT